MKTVSFNAKAPDKPSIGEPCNGCGVCCAMTPCAVGIFLLRQKREANCRALEWDEPQNRYQCGVAARPGRFFTILPAFMEKPAGRLISRWISAGSGCDCAGDFYTAAPKPIR
ncbi:MAG: hypothetical protein HZB29_13980 [Nitrospinae bacterium]|nr:hypothetical protein [Nitrospinota bacterium]